MKIRNLVYTGSLLTMPATSMAQHRRTPGTTAQQPYRRPQRYAGRNRRAAAACAASF